MVTLVGTQSDFVKALQELAELDYDAIEAYKVAIDKLRNDDYKEEMKSFQKDHERHVEEINKILVSHGGEIIESPSGKQWLTKGKVALANMISEDKGILNAMLSNEEETNEAYKRMNHHEHLFPDAVETVRKGLQDERKHKKWIEEALKSFD